MKFVLEALRLVLVQRLETWELIMREKLVLHVIVSLNVLSMNPYVPRGSFP